MQEPLGFLRYILAAVSLLNILQPKHMYLLVRFQVLDHLQQLSLMKTVLFTMLRV